MTTIVQVANANEMCQEYTRITTMLNMVQGGAYTLQATVISTALPVTEVTAVVAPSQAAFTTLLQNRQTALASQLAALGITVT